MTHQLFCGFLLCSFCLPAQAEKLTSVADLRYGVVLYEYFQQNYTAALSELMVAEARGGIKGHKENPKLIEGGISLAFGMENRASDIFNELLNEEQPEEVRNTAWFYLAKLRYQQGNWQGSENSLAKIDSESRLDNRLAIDRVILALNLSIRQGDLSRAEQLLPKIPTESPLLPYAYYNLGAAYSRQNLHDRALPFYQKLVELTEDDFHYEEFSPVSVQQQQREILALYDKSLTAAGYSLMLEGDYERAIEQFSQVRRDGEFSRRALLGYGWAAARAEKFELALQPWQALTQDSLTYAPVQEAILAIPYAYESLGAEGQALQKFVAAQTEFEQEIRRLDEVVETVSKAPLSEFLLVEDDPHGWLALDQQLGNAPQRAYLSRLFSENEFHGSVQNLQDLQNLQQQLDQWSEKLSFYRYSWQQRHDSRMEKQRLFAERPWQQQAEKLQENGQVLQSRLDHYVKEGDYIALAPKSIQSLYQRVVRGKDHLERLQKAILGGDTSVSPQTISRYSEQLQRYEGLLFWQASELFHQQLNQQKKGLSELSTHLSQLNTDQQRVERSLAAAPDIAPFEPRIQTLRLRLDKQRERVQVARKEAEARLTQQVVQHLLQQRQRLQHYLAQARLSTARLYDAALQEQQ